MQPMQMHITLTMEQAKVVAEALAFYEDAIVTNLADPDFCERTPLAEHRKMYRDHFRCRALASNLVALFNLDNPKG